MEPVLTSDRRELDPIRSGQRRAGWGRWRRYSLRGLILLVTAAAVGCGWVMYRVRGFADQAAFIKELRARRFGIEVEPIADPGMWRYLVPQEQLVEVRMAFSSSVKHEWLGWGQGSSSTWIGLNPADLERMREWTKIEVLFAEGQYVTDETMADWRRFECLGMLVLGNTSITNQGLSGIGRMSNLTQLSMGWDDENLSSTDRHGRITDEGLVGLSALKKLKSLSLINCQIGDEGLRCLASMHPQLESLTVRTTGKITDGGLKELARLNLESLELSEAEITDTGLGVLHGWKCLAAVSVRGPRITRHGVEALIAARPDLGDAESMMKAFGLKTEAGGQSRK